MEHFGEGRSKEKEAAYEKQSLQQKQIHHIY